MRSAADPAGERELAQVDGTDFRSLIAHSLASTGRYVGSPSLAILPGGVYVASHDFFGPSTKEFEVGVTHIYRSRDRGATWSWLAEISPAFWSGLFVEGEDLYLLGTTHHHGQVVIRRSCDEGETWTTPLDKDSGLLTGSGQYHTAPVPLIRHAGKIWRAVENADRGTMWGIRYSPMVMSVPIGLDLLRRKNWTFSQDLPNDTGWIGGTFGGWLEGNVVAGPTGDVVNILRVDTPAGEKAAYVEISEDGVQLSFDPESGFIDFPGGATKFTIRKDPQEGRYWALVNSVRHYEGDAPATKIRNVLSVMVSDDLLCWTLCGTLLQHPDEGTYGFQYTDWLFEGDDIVAAIRTAAPWQGEAPHSPHDANLLTFHRFPGFRTMSPDSENHSEDKPMSPRGHREADTPRDWASGPANDL